MYDLQITYLSSNQRRIHMVRFLCCFAVKKLKQHKSVRVLIVCHFLSSLSWRDKWLVSWFNDFIGRFLSATKPRLQGWPTLSIVWQPLKLYAYVIIKDRKCKKTERPQRRLPQVYKSQILNST